MSYSPHKITIDLDEYNELIALNVTYNKFLHQLNNKNMVYSIEVEESRNTFTHEMEYISVLKIHNRGKSSNSGWSLSWSLEEYNVGDTYSSKLAEVFDRGLDYLETLK